jgi:hypothetical protein
MNTLQIKLTYFFATFRMLIRNCRPYRLFNFYREYAHWERRGFSEPSPILIKQAFLLKHGTQKATWVETGTYLGQTTEALANFGCAVISIEPQTSLFNSAKNYFHSFPNVKILNGTSEEIFPSLLPTIRGDVNFWLDGHYSDGITFKGNLETPILVELQQIAMNKSKYQRIKVFIDDIRCFGSPDLSYKHYPQVQVLIDWAKDNDMKWHIEHDIFLAHN